MKSSSVALPANGSKNRIKKPPAPETQEKEKQEPKKKKFSLGTLLLCLILFMGVFLLIYPWFSDYWNSFHQSRAIASYAETVAETDETELLSMWNEAMDYNNKLRQKPDRMHPTEEETKEYERILDVSGTGIIGYIEIPLIKVSLPIYHGTDEAVLQIAIGHIEGSSLPVGGIGTHCVLSGHRGLPSARLFSDLDKMSEGDYFVIRVLNETLTYQVDQILIVEPTDTSALAIDPKKDYCTLVTCTPYGINSHRMLVRGHRVENLKESETIMATADAQMINRNLVALCIGGPMLVILFLREMIVGGKKARRKIARWEAADEAYFGKLYETDEEPADEEPDDVHGLRAPPIEPIVYTDEIKTSGSMTYSLKSGPDGKFHLQRGQEERKKTIEKTYTSRTTIRIDYDENGKATIHEETQIDHKKE